MIRVVAIDGPAGSGKSTVARGVADALGLEVLDTGAMYRAVTLLALEGGFDPGDGEAIAQAAGRAVLELGDPPGSIRLDGRDVSREIRGPAVSTAVSQVSSHPPVRTLLRRRQREWAEQRGGGVVEGRDIGTVVFTDAPLKVFLTASEDERARRRHRDEHDAARPADLEAVRDAVDRRDALDHRTTPLAPAPDAVVIDTTGRTVEDIVDKIVERWQSTVTPSESGR
ncbi:MAG TPA: (d)CMP kinase [Acidimicrobiia bacterium]|nr:(d)CMP kinase [Acidimicrobiia bacterium]